MAYTEIKRQKAENKKEGASLLPFAFLLLPFLILCLLYNITLPVFEASDEASHFRYADYLAAERQLPNLARDLPSHEVTQPVLYYALVALAISPFDRSDLDQINKLNPDWFDRSLNADYKNVKNLHVHTPAEVWPWQSVVWAVHAGRLVSSLLGVLTIILVYGIAAHMNGHAPLTNLLVTALVAFNPKFIHVSSIVSNDIAVTLAATAACWWMVRELAEPVRETAHNHALRFGFVLGLLCGAAVLCKLSGIGLLAPAAVCLWLRFRGAGLIRPALTFAAGYALTAGVWFAYNTFQYGNPLAWEQVQLANAALLRVPPLTLPEILARIPRVLETYWGTVAIELDYPAWVNVIFAALLIAAVVGIIIAVVRASRQPPATNNQPLIWLILIIWELALLALFVVWLRGYVGTENGRLILPGVAPVALAVVAGWKALAAQVPARWRANLHRPLAGSVVAGLFTLSVATPFWIIRPAFAEPVYLSQAQQAALTNANPLTFAGQVQVLKGEVIDSATRVKPGQSVRVRLVWGAAQPIPQSLRIVLDATDLDGSLISEKRAIPFEGRFNTQRWPVGQFFEDVYELPIPADARRGPATVRVSVFAQYPQPGLLKMDGTDSTTLDLGKVKIDAPVAQTQAGATPVTPIATFGDSIALTQLDLKNRTWQWRALKPPGRNYTLFIHAFDAQGNLIWQSDEQPLGSGYPTGLWDAGDTIDETRSIELARVSRMVIGWYDADTGARLPAFKPDGTPWPDDAALIYQAPS